MNADSNKPPVYQKDQSKSIALVESIQFLRENLAIISALSVAGGTALSTIFLSAYLSVFDWHLLWFVQYPDLLTFGLIAAGLIGGSFLLLQSASQAVLSATALKGKSKTRWLIALPTVFVLLLGFDLYATIQHGDGYFHILFGAGIIVTGVLLILVVLSHVRSASWPTAMQAAAIVSLAAINALSFGQWLGHSLLETSQFDQDVRVKNGMFNAVKVVAVMSRNTILLKEGII